MASLEKIARAGEENSGVGCGGFSDFACCSPVELPSKRVRWRRFIARAEKGQDVGHQFKVGRASASELPRVVAQDGNHTAQRSPFAALLALAGNRALMKRHLFIKIVGKAGQQVIQGR